MRRRKHSRHPEALPVPGERWVVRRKAALIEAVRTNLITLEEACRRYELSPEEFANWVATISKHGVPGLRATRFQIYRDSPVSRRTGILSGPNQRLEGR